MSDYIGAVRAGFTQYCVDYNNLIGAREDDVGPYPQFPAIIVADSDYTDVVTARIGWAAARVAINELITGFSNDVILDAAFLVVESELAPNTWTKLEAASSGDFYPFLDTVWIGFSLNNFPNIFNIWTTAADIAWSEMFLANSTIIPKIVISQSEPTVPFSKYNPIMPTLIPAEDATVDANFEILFSYSDINYSNSITHILIQDVDMVNCSSDARSLIIPIVGNTILQTPGTYEITLLASGYPLNIVTQNIQAGTPSQIIILTQPMAPATNPGLLTIQPILHLKDQYGNLTNGSAVASAKSSAFTLTGTTTVAAVSGVVTFTNLDVADVSEVPDAQITFTSNSLSVDSNSFDIPAPATCATVTGLVIPPFSSGPPPNTANATWDARAGATFYFATSSVFVRPSSGSFSSTSGNSHTIFGTQGVRIFFWLYAICSNSVQSADVTGSTI